MLIDIVTKEPVEWPNIKFYKTDCEKIFNRIYNILRTGFSSEESFEILEDLYATVSEEYGD